LNGGSRVFFRGGPKLFFFPQFVPFEKNINFSRARERQLPRLGNGHAFGGKCGFRIAKQEVGGGITGDIPGEADLAEGPVVRRGVAFNVADVGAKGEGMLSLVQETSSTSW